MTTSGDCVTHSNVAYFRDYRPPTFRAQAPCRDSCFRDSVPVQHFTRHVSSTWSRQAHSCTVGIAPHADDMSGLDRTRPTSRVTCMYHIRDSRLVNHKYNHKYLARKLGRSKLRSTLTKLLRVIYDCMWGASIVNARRSSVVSAVH